MLGGLFDHHRRDRVALPAPGGGRGRAAAAARAGSRRPGGPTRRPLRPLAGARGLAVPGGGSRRAGAPLPGPGGRTRRRGARGRALETAAARAVRTPGQGLGAAPGAAACRPNRIRGAAHLPRRRTALPSIPKPPPHRGRSGTSRSLELPGYKPPAWLEEDVPEGSIRSLRLRSGRLRDVGPGTAVEPARDAVTDEPLPLLVVHDGPEYAVYSDLVQLPRRCPPPGPAYPRCARRCWHRCAGTSTTRPPPRYSDALVGELLPALARGARSPTGTRPVGMGASLGALSFLHAHRRHPSSFAGLFLQSGSFFRQRFDSHEADFPRFRRITRFMGTVLGASGGRIRSRSGSPVAPAKRTASTTPGRGDCAGAAGISRGSARDPRRAHVDRLARRARPAPARAAGTQHGAERPSRGGGRGRVLPTATMAVRCSRSRPSRATAGNTRSAAWWTRSATCSRPGA